MQKATDATCESSISEFRIVRYSYRVISVHDIRPLYPTAETETESSVGAPDNASEADTAGSEQHEWQSQSEERPRDSGKGERGNYYPITWRVIGGGVMMSGPRESPVISLSLSPLTASQAKFVRITWLVVVTKA